MPSIRVVLLPCLALLLAIPAAAAAPRVAGEPSRTPVTKAFTAWRAEAVPAHAVARLHYGEMSAERIFDLQQSNAGRVGKPLQIGIAREASGESTAGELPALQWMRQGDGAAIARLELVSPLAYGIRAGLRIRGLDPRAELRFSGSAWPDLPVATLSAGQAAALLGDDGLFWTPATEGERQVIDIRLPPGASTVGATVQAPRLSHLMTNATDKFRILKNIGNSGSCNIDTVCRLDELGPHFADARAAVARMVFIMDGGSYYCTGTLLNDTDPSSQVPWFHTAHHCISTAEMAATLNTYWNYESTTCNVDVAADWVLRSGGADYLYSSEATDGALLRLRDAAPAGATFAGWDAGPLPASIAVTAIHHPAGDLKKVSFGQHLPARSDAESHAAGWLEGTTEGGSSGSGLFTRDQATGYYLRGGLHGGNALCSNSGSLSNTNNVDWYSRFDVDFPSIEQYLAPEAPAAPRRRNGSQPLAPR